MHLLYYTHYNKYIIILLYILSAIHKSESKSELKIKHFYIT